MSTKILSILILSILIFMALSFGFLYYSFEGTTSSISLASSQSPTFLPNTTLTTSSGTSDWGQFHGNSTHNGYSIYSGPEESSILWEKKVGGSYDGLEAYNGNLLVSEAFPSQAQSGGISELYEKNGTYYKNMSIPTDYEGHYNVGTSYPSTGSGLIVFGDYPGGVRFLAADELSTGQNVWTYGNPNPGFTPLYDSDMNLFYNGMVYDVPYGSNTITAVTASTGNVLWMETLQANIATIPTAGNGNIVVGFSNKPILSDIVATSGDYGWNVTLDGFVSDTPSYCNGFFYFGTTNGTLYKVSQQGNIAWTFHSGASIETTSTIANDLVYFGNDAGALYAIYDVNGSVAWRYNSGSSFVSSPVATSNGLVFIADTGGTVYSFLAISGTLNWKDNVGASIIASPVLDDGSLFVVTTNEVVYAFGNEYQINFIESGLPSDTGWNVSLNSTNKTSDGNLIQFNVQNGSYSYKIREVIGYSASPSSGIVITNGRNQNVSITFSQGWSFPSAPLNLSATGSLGQIVLNWFAPENNGAPPGFTGSGIESYYIYRNTTPGQETYYDKVNGSQLSYVDTSVNPGTIYFYTVTSVNPVGQSGFSNEASAQSEVITNPSPPQNLTALSVSAKGVELSWNSPSSNGGSPITEYVIYRYTSDQSATAIGNAPPNTTTYLDSSVHAGNTYYYYVVAINQAGTSNPSSTLTVVIPTNIFPLPWYDTGIFGIIGFGTFIGIVVSVIIAITTIGVFLHTRGMRLEGRRR